MEEKTTMTGAYLTRDYRDKLAKILEVNKRTIRGQIEAWIDEETRIIERNRK